MSGNPDRDRVIAALRALKPELEARYRVASMSLFGSYAHGAQGPASDLDLLVSFKEVRSLYKFIELENLLTEALGVKVDLVMDEALKPNLRRRLHQETVAI
jgi:predicted nucleotidyltransferase